MENQIKDFNRRGWMICRQIIDPVDMDSIRSRIADIRVALDAAVGTDKYRKRTGLLLTSSVTAKVVMKVVEHIVVKTILKRSFQFPIIEHTKVLIKAAGAPLTSWHQDAEFWKSFDPRQTMFTVWVALMDVGTDNGCLRLLDERTSIIYPHEPVHLDSELAINQRDLGLLLDRYVVVDCPLKAGDALIFKSQMIHAAYSNGTGTHRMAFKIVFQDLAKRPRNAPLSDRSVKLQGISGWLNHWSPCVLTRMHLKYRALRSTIKNAMVSVRGQA